jgi:hypothetical protein
LLWRWIEDGSLACAQTSAHPLSRTRLVGERPGKSHRERHRIGLEFLCAFWRGSPISDGDLDYERVAANVLFTPADPGADMVLIERVQLYGDALAHDPPCHNTRLPAEYGSLILRAALLGGASHYFRRFVAPSIKITGCWAIVGA